MLLLQELEKDTSKINSQITQNYWIKLEPKELSIYKGIFRDTLLRSRSLKSMTLKFNGKNLVATYPDNGVQFGHGDLLRPLHSVGHLLLMLQCHAIIIASSSHSTVRSHGTRARQKVKNSPLAPGTEALARLSRSASWRFLSANT